MIIDFKRQNDEERIETGSIILSNQDDILLVVESENAFNVFDLESGILRRYESQKEFQQDIQIIDVYKDDEIKITLSR